jgi:NADP-dependent 3-hydroxy acid dehydrogenase YdfG
MDLFKNKIAVITGAASGIGKAIAKESCKRGMKLVLSDINKEQLEILLQELKETNQNVIAVCADVSKKIDIQKIVKATISAFRGVDILFNNAGIAGPFGAIWEVDQLELEKVIKVNLMSVIYGLCLFIPIMIKENKECWIINTASGAGLYTNGSLTSNLPGYVASKHAVVALSEHVYLYLQKRNLKVNVSVLCPGSVATNLLDSIRIDKKNNSIEKFKNKLANSMAADSVAKQVFKGIQNKEFYILTHYKEQQNLIQNRMNNILKRKNPK